MQHRSITKKGVSHSSKIIWRIILIISILFFNAFIAVIWIGIFFIKIGFHFSSSENRPEMSLYDYDSHLNTSAY